jgi:acetyl-CoA C-acetyltransferase
LADLPAIVGAFEHPLRKAPNYTPLRFIGECAAGALADAGLRKGDIDGLATAGDTMAVNYISEYLDLKPRWFDSTSIGGSAFLSHIIHAADAIRQGRARAVLIVYGSTTRSSAAKFGSSGRPEVSDPMGVYDADAFYTPYGVNLVSQYALVARRHMHEYGTTREQLAEIAVTCRANAALNPLARFRDPITIEDVIGSRPIATPLHMLDCCVVTDGGGAVIVASSEFARDCAKKPVRILGGSEATNHREGGHHRLLDVAAKQSGPAAFAVAGVKHDDVDLCMLYDSFTITVLTSIEGLGFCKPGEGGNFVEGGRLRLDGTLPINPDGGALSNHHPGRRGIFLAIEATRQLRNEGGPCQVTNARIALCHGSGGNLSDRHSGVTIILGAD